MRNQCILNTLLIMKHIMCYISYKDAELAEYEVLGNLDPRLKFSLLFSCTVRCIIIRPPKTKTMLYARHAKNTICLFAYNIK